MAINTSKVLVGGIVAGLWFAVVDVLTYGVLLADRMQAELGAVAPAAAERLADTGVMPLFIALDLVFGLLVAWLYAAVRPRFGPGMGTAVYVGVFLWVIATLMYSMWPIAGLMAGSTFVLGSLIWLVALIVGAAIAGRLYSEEAPVAAGPPAM